MSDGHRKGERAMLLCGLVGPASFITAWSVAGARRDGYDPVATTISRLAEEGSSTAALMTSGFVAFGVLIPVYAVALGRRLGSPAVAATTAVAGLATLGVAATRLTVEGGQSVDLLHQIAAGTGYLATAVTPALAASLLGSRTAARASYAVSATSLLALVASLSVDGAAGLGQRVGLTVVDSWWMTMAVVLATRNRRSRR